MSRKTWIYVLAATGALTFAIGGSAFWLTSQALQAAPITVETPALVASDLRTARNLINRHTVKGVFKGRPLHLSLTQRQAQALLHDAAQRVIQAPAALSLQTQAARVQASLPIRATPLKWLSPLGEWLNVQVDISTDAKGKASLQHVQVGELQLPPALAIWLGQRFLAHHGLLELSELGWSAIDRVILSPHRIGVVVRWQPAMSAQASALLLPPHMQEALVHAHQLLAQQLQGPDDTADNATWPPPHIQLDTILPRMMAQAQQRSLARALSSASSPASDAAALDNRAILLVLGLYVNQVSLASFIPEARDWPRLPERVVTLHGRTDLAQHFLTSAAMATDLGGRLSDLIGVYKELLDASPQGRGSGFSFNDLAADKAGVRFGRLSMNQALEMQQRMAQVQDESDFMPKVDDLPEFLSERQFRERFGGVDAPAYRAMIADIERRVAETPALR